MIVKLCAMIGGGRVSQAHKGLPFVPRLVTVYSSFHRRLSVLLPSYYPDEFNHRQPVSELKII